MAKRKRILIVEDERIIAEDIKRTLKNFGYDVIKIVSNGLLAIETTLIEKPDLVLMDIMLEGKMNGIEAAQAIRAQIDIPIIYLTAYADETTLKDAKITQPFGYIIKPFEERELHATLEMAFYRNVLESALRESEKKYRSLVENMDEGIVIVDDAENFTFVNNAAVTIFGYPKEDLLKMSMRDFTSPAEFDYICQKTKLRMEGISDKYELTITARGGHRHYTTITASPMIIDGTYHGTFAVISDVTMRKKAEQLAASKTEQQEYLLKAAHVLNTTLDIHEVLKMIGEGAADILRCYTCAIYILDADDEVLKPVIALDPDFSDETMSTTLTLRGSYTGKAVLQKQPMYFNDAGLSDEGMQIPGTSHIANERIIVAPLISEDSVLGAITLSRIGEVFTEEDLILAGGYANFAANALKNAQTFSALQEEMQERKRAEKELQRTQFRLATIFKNVPNILIYENHPDNRYISENILDMLGFNAIDFTSQKVDYMSLLHHDDREIIKEKIEKWNDQGRQGMLSLWYRMQHRNGHYLFMEDRMISMTDDDGVAYTAGVLIDNTALKEVEEKLRKSESRYRAVVEDQTELISRYDPEGKMTFVNAAYCRFYGRTAEDMLGEFWIGRLPENIQDLLIKRLNSLSPQNPSATYEYPTIRDGKSYWIEWTYRAIYDTNNKLIEYQSVGNDITARKQAEEEKDKIQQQFLQAQKMEMIGRLAGGIAHDFNNLLTAINGYAEMALKKVGTQDRVYNDIQVILRSGEKAARLTQQLLGFSRQQVVNLKPINLDSSITEMEQMLNHLIGEDIKLMQRTNTYGSLIEADQGQIEQILVNLVVNARDAISGKGRIVVSTANQTVHTDLNAIGRKVPADDYVVLTVEDTGSGIPEEIQTKIFDPFFTTKEVGKGTGLGLATVISIVEQNKGYLTLETKAGEGTIFSIYFPRIEGDEPEEIHEVNEAELPTGTEVILLVEDEDYIREFVADILEEHGYQVLQAEDGQDALDLIHEKSPAIDLLFTDVRMPNIKGPELAERMLSQYPNLKVIFVSGYSDDKRIREGIPSLQSDFVQKPFNVPTLITKVRTILDS